MPRVSDRHRRGGPGAARVRAPAAGPARGDRGGPRRPRHAGGHVHRLGQVGDLPDRRAAPRRRRPSSSRRSSRCSATRSSGEARRGGAVLNSTLSERAREEVFEERGRRASSSSSCSRPSSSPTTRCSSACARRGRRCSSSTRRTACPSGATTSGPTTCGSATSVERARPPAGARADGDGVAAGARRTSSSVLRLRDPEMVVRGFDRPNIWLGVEHFRDERAQARGRCSTRWSSAAAAGHRLRGDAARRARSSPRRCASAACGRTPTTAGCGRGGASEVQEAFMDDAGGRRDRRDDRLRHGRRQAERPLRRSTTTSASRSTPTTRSSGRAGRDGEPARALLFYRPEDLGRCGASSPAGSVDRAALERVARGARRGRGRPVDAAAHARRSSTLSQDASSRPAVHRLEEAGVVDVQRRRARARDRRRRTGSTTRSRRRRAAEEDRERSTARASR